MPVFGSSSETQTENPQITENEMHTENPQAFNKNSQTSFRIYIFNLINVFIKS